MSSTSLRHLIRGQLFTVLAVILTVTMVAGCASSDEPASEDAAPAPDETSASEEPDEPATSAEAELLEHTEIERPSKSEEIAALLPDEIAEQGHLVVASGPYPTAVIVPEDGGEARGWEISTGEALGAVLGIEFQFEVVPFTQIIPGLAAGRYDIAMGSIAITDDRLEEVTFVTAHQTRNSVLTAVDSTLEVESLLDLCGVRYGILSGSTQAERVPELQEGCDEADLEEVEVVTFNSMNDATLGLTSGRIDVQGANSDIHAYLMTQQPDEYKIVFEYDVPRNFENVPPGASGIAIARHDYTPELAEALSAALNALIEDGTHQAILDHWNLGKGGVEDAVVMPPA